MAESKQKQWDDACSSAEQALQKLIDLQDDCRTKYEEMSEKMQESERGEKLSVICDLDLQGAMDTIQDATTAELL